MEDKLGFDRFMFRPNVMPKINPLADQIFKHS